MVTWQPSKRGSSSCPLTTLLGWLAPHHWAPGPSHPRPRPRPARSPPGWPVALAQPVPPGTHRSWGGWESHCSVDLATSLASPGTSLLRKNWLAPTAHPRPPILTSRTGSCSGPVGAGRAQPRLPAALPAALVASCHPCHSARGQGRTLGKWEGASDTVEGSLHSHTMC